MLDRIRGLLGRKKTPPKSADNADQLLVGKDANYAPIPERGDNPPSVNTAPAFVVSGNVRLPKAGNLRATPDVAADLDAKLPELTFIRQKHTIIVSSNQKQYALVNSFDEQEKEEFLKEYPQYENTFKEVNGRYKFIGGAGEQGLFRIAREVKQNLNLDGSTRYEYGKFVGVKKTRNIFKNEDGILINKTDDPGQLQKAIKETLFYTKYVKPDPVLSQTILPIYSVAKTANRKADADSFNNPLAATFYLFVEIASGGKGEYFYASLSNKSAEEKERLVINAVTTFIEDVATWHARGIYHRDLKAKNVLLQKDGVVKLTDFGAAYAESDNFEVSCDADMTRWPPELYFNPAVSSYALMDDWATGLTVLELCGVDVDAYEAEMMVWNAGTRDGGEFEQRISGLIENNAQQIPASVLPIVKGLLEIDPVKRMSADEALQFIRKQPTLRGDGHSIRFLAEHPELFVDDAWTMLQEKHQQTIEPLPPELSPQHVAPPVTVPEEFVPVDVPVVEPVLVPPQPVPVEIPNKTPREMLADMVNDLAECRRLAGKIEAKVKQLPHIEEMSALQKMGLFSSHYRQGKGAQEVVTIKPTNKPANP